MNGSKLRVLMLTSVFPRWDGDATPPFVQNLCERLVEEGMEVMVLSPHASGTAFHESIKGVDVRRHPYILPFALQKLCYEGGMLVNFKVRPWTRLLLPFFFLSQLLSALYLCLKFKPNMIHTHSLVPQGFTGVIVSRMLSLPHVTTSHGNDVFGLKPTGLMGRLKRVVLTYSDAITVNSSATLQAVKEQQPNVSENRIHLIPAVPNEYPINAELVDTIRQRFRAKKLILFAGRLIEEKGVYDLFDALCSVLPELADACAIFVGDGPERAELSRRVSASEVSDRIHLVGWQPKEDISSWMAASDLLVVPSKQVDGWQEAQGLVVVEAMAVGTPIVASRLGGIPDMIKDGETGTLVDMGDVNGICQAINRALQVSALAKVTIENARAHYDAQYSQTAVCARLLKVYQHLEN